MDAPAGSLEPMDRPSTVKVASALLVANSLILVAWWFIEPSGVESKGAQVFFSILWLSVGISVFRGYGWVRYATFVVLVIFLVEVINTGTPMSALQHMSFGDQTSKGIALVALVLLFLPQSGRWYKQIREYAKTLEGQESTNAT